MRNFQEAKELRNDNTRFYAVVVNAYGEDKFLGPNRLLSKQIHADCLQDDASTAQVEMNKYAKTLEQKRLTSGDIKLRVVQIDCALSFQDKIKYKVGDM